MQKLYAIKQDTNRSIIVCYYCLAFQTISTHVVDPLPAYKSAILANKQLGISCGAPLEDCLMATILHSLVVSCAKKLQDVTLEEAILILGVKEELRQMQRTMKQIQCFLHDIKEGQKSQQLTTGLET
jgi:hypothetical protein